jgi:hypothetical protein
MNGDKNDITTEVAQIGGNVFETDVQTTTRIEVSALNHIITVLGEIDTFWENHLTAFKYGIVKLDLKIEGPHDKAESIAKIIHYKLGYPDCLDKLLDTVLYSQGESVIETATTLLYTTLSMYSMDELFGGNVDLMNGFLDKIHQTRSVGLLFDIHEEHLDTNLNTYLANLSMSQLWTPFDQLWENLEIIDSHKSMKPQENIAEV